MIFEVSSAMPLSCCPCALSVLWVKYESKTGPEPELWWCLMNTEGIQRLAGQSAFLQAEGEDCTAQRCQPCLWIFLLQVETFSESEKKQLSTTQMYNNYLVNIGIQLFLPGSKLMVGKSHFLTFIILDSIFSQHFCFPQFLFRVCFVWLLSRDRLSLLFVWFVVAATCLFLF